MRPGKLLTIGVVVLAVGTLVADRGAKLAIERVAATRIQNSVDTSKRPSVDMGGFPFLTELVRGKFNNVTVDMVGASGGKVTVAHIHADLHGVRQDPGGVLADSITGTGHIDYAALSAAAQAETKLPMQVSYGGENLVQVTAKVSVLGRSLTASASGQPRIEHSTLIVKPERASTSVTGDAGEAAAAVPEVSLPLRDIPPNLDVKLNPNAGGVDFTFDGTDVRLTANYPSTRSSAPASEPVWPATVPERRQAWGAQAHRLAF